MGKIQMVQKYVNDKKLVHQKVSVSNRTDFWQKNTVVCTVGLLKTQYVFLKKGSGVSFACLFPPNHPPWARNPLYYKCDILHLTPTIYTGHCFYEMPEILMDSYNKRNVEIQKKKQY